MGVNESYGFPKLSSHYFYWKFKVRIVGNDYCLIEIFVKTID